MERSFERPLKIEFKMIVVIRFLNHQFIFYIFKNDISIVFDSK